MNTVTLSVVSNLVSKLSDFNSPISVAMLDSLVEQAMETEGVDIPASIMTRIGILRAQVDNAYDTPEAKKLAMEQAHSCMGEVDDIQRRKGRVLFLLKLSNRSAHYRVRLARAELTEEARHLGVTPTFFH